MVPAAITAKVTVDTGARTFTYSALVTDVTHAGVHELKVNANDKNGDAIPGKEEKITLTVTDPCEPPTSVTPSTV